MPLVYLRLLLAWTKDHRFKDNKVLVVSHWAIHINLLMHTSNCTGYSIHTASVHMHGQFSIEASMSCWIDWLLSISSDLAFKDQINVSAVDVEVLFKAPYISVPHLYLIALLFSESINKTSASLPKLLNQCRQKKLVLGCNAYQTVEACIPTKAAHACTLTVLHNTRGNLCCARACFVVEWVLHHSCGGR